MLGATHERKKSRVFAAFKSPWNFQDGGRRGALVCDGDFIVEVPDDHITASLTTTSRSQPITHVAKTRLSSPRALFPFSRRNVVSEKGDSRRYVRHPVSDYARHREPPIVFVQHCPLSIRPDAAVPSATANADSCVRELQRERDKRDSRAFLAMNVRRFPEKVTLSFPSIHGSSNVTDSFGILASYRTLVRI